MSDKRYQFLVSGPDGSVCFETDSADILRQVGDVLKDPSVGQVLPPEPKTGRPKKPVYVIEASDLFSFPAGTRFADAFAAALALEVAPLTVRQAFYIARKRGENFAKVRGVTLSYERVVTLPEAPDLDLLGHTGKVIIVTEVDGDVSSLKPFDQLPSAVMAAEILQTSPHSVTQALYVARKAGKTQAKVKGVTLSYLDDYAAQNVRD